MERIKFSVEIPPKVLKVNPNLLTFLDYDFVIASMYLESEEYKDYYLNNQRPGTILDNGAFETGTAIDVGVYLRIMDELRPATIVISDVRRDCEKTLLKANEFFDRLPPGFDTNRLMGALQGNSIEDYEKLLGVYTERGVRLIGIPYGAIDRVNFIKQHPETKFHVLGLQYFPELLSLRLLENVVSVDTSLPVKFAANRKFLARCNCLTIEQRPDFDKGFDTVQSMYLFANLNFIHKICDRSNNFSVMCQEDVNVRV